MANDAPDADALPPDVMRAAIEQWQPQCMTAPDMSGMPCKCDYSCRNYWLRKKGLGVDSPEPAVRTALEKRLGNM